MQRLIWRLRLLVFPTARIHLHLPSAGRDLDQQWRDFSRSEHRVVRNEIESYLKSRLGGISFDTYEKGSEGEWQGQPEKNTVFYLDLDFRLRDVEWFFRMKDVWGSERRFNQELIYITFQPIWILEKTRTEKENEKRNAGSGNPAS